MSEEKTLRKGVKFRLYPTISQQRELNKIFGSCRYVYNRLLSENTDLMELHKLYPSDWDRPVTNASEFSSILNKWKKEQGTNWLNNVSAVALQQTTRNLETAFRKFFSKKTGYPAFKSKRGEQSIQFTALAYRVKNNKLCLPKFDSGIRMQLSRDLPETIKTATVSKTPTGRYYVSFVTEVESTRVSGKGTIGIDAGITDIAVLSTGEQIKNPRHFVTYQKKLARAQRAHARKKKGSKNKEKSRIRVAKIHEKIKNLRNDYLHKLSSRIVRENQAIAIEQLNVLGMMKNRKLSKHIGDAAWGRFREMLMYKVSETQEGKLLLADPYLPSTQTCNVCLTRPEVKIKLGVTKWTCATCDTTHQRDVNAAKTLEVYLKAFLKNWEPGIRVKLGKGTRTIAAIA